MKSEVVFMINFLKKLNLDITFRPDTGAFRSKLAKTVTANVDEECVELFYEHNCDIQVSISSHTIEEDIIRFMVISDLGEQALECALSVLNDYEINDLTEQLSKLVAEQSPSVTRGISTVIVRKKPVNGMLDIHQAAQQLGCSQIFLKNRIPCTDYSYYEVDGKKEIKEYYWSQHLIDRLCHIKLHGSKTEDVKYIAQECCDSDCKWAEEILVSLGCSMLTTKFDGALSNGITKRPAKIISKELTNPRPSRKKHP